MRTVLILIIGMLSGYQHESPVVKPVLPDVEIQIQIESKMKQFETSELPGRLAPTPERIAGFEAEIGTKLPDDYRVFLGEYSGMRIELECPVSEPTPFGDQASIETFYGFFDSGHGYNSLNENSALSDGAPTLIPIASGYFGSQVFLFVSGKLEGQDYFRDGQGRAAWPDDQFERMFSNLAPDIKSYLKLRQEGGLPDKAGEFLHFYKLANTFTEYLEACNEFGADDDAG